MNMRHGGTFRIFAEAELRQYLSERIERLKAQVRSEREDYVLNVQMDEYVEHLVDTYSVEPLMLNFDGVSVESHERDIPAEYFPGGGFDFNVRRGAQYRKSVIRYHVPFAGNEDLLRCAPSSRLVWSEEIFLHGSEVCFELIDFYGDPERIKSQAAQLLRNMQAGNVATEVGQYNNGLKALAGQVVAERRRQLEGQKKVVSALGVPIRRSGTIPETFVVPTVRKKIVVKPAAAPGRKEEPAPVLAPELYGEILKTVHEMGKVFERYPSTYAGKDEEALRDHLILQLEPRFEGSITGETFNKAGKTDILIRYEKTNIFVAECKFWKGKAQHLRTIDQILSYLTWRDSKTAIIYFVKGKEITPVLAEIRVRTAEHKDFVRSLGEKDPSWQMYEFHLPGDAGCKIQLGVLTFHIPE